MAFNKDAPLYQIIIQSKENNLNMQKIVPKTKKLMVQLTAHQIIYLCHIFIK
jgi:hypothetical protein